MSEILYTAGCYDTKVTSYKNGAMQGKADIINGPTRSANEGDLPPFSWAQFSGQKHLGLPQVYDFGFVSTEPYNWGASAPGKLRGDKNAVQTEV